MNPVVRDLILYIGTTFGPYTFAFNQTQSRRVGEFTADKLTDTLILSDFDLDSNDQVRLETSEVLPAPLSINTYYYLFVVDQATFQLSTSFNGPPIDILDSGTGTHTLIKRGIPLDLTDWTFWSWVKNDLDDPKSSVVLDLAPFILDVPNGLVQIILHADGPTEDGLEISQNEWSLLGQPPGFVTDRIAFYRGKFDIAKISTHP